jgi:hypothetical protein
MSRFRDNEEYERSQAEFAEWQDRVERETLGLTAEECKEIAGRNASARLHRVERQERLVTGLRDMLLARPLYGDAACERIGKLLEGQP